eukprot:CAMPEP_0117562980 /NCGR_PEP_ID=MMETSP0784-20121206/55253_1 /TAXON_ID=39447 /ORGANISM="" /LENGTH=543 /DNA_ID=CAMNT_0005360601 /DNA_START=23 /DNA_END=1655 /DNA_ORIENTATION=-
MTSVEEPEAEIFPGDEMAGMHVEAVPRRHHVLCGVRNTVHLVVRICTPKVDESQAIRPSLRVACVMDCSSSMRGEKLVYAKKAVLKLVKHLTDRDTLHLVTYDTTARAVFKDGDLSEIGKEGLRLRIDSIRACGKTNLCGGLDLAASLLSAAVDNDGANDSSESGSNLPCAGVTTSGHGKAGGVMRRIFLFSDGRVNAGITDPQAILRQVSTWASAGITIGTFGIGADFDEPLMRGIAASGQGRYQFLASANDIPKLVSKSVHDLLGIHASDATLDIRGCDHTTVTRVYGNHDDAGGSRAPSTPGLLHLGDVHSDNLRVVLVELEVAPPGSIRKELAFDAVEWVLTCQRKGAPVRFSGRVQLLPTRDRTRLGDEASSVHVAFAVRRAADLEKKVAEHLSRRDRKQAHEIKRQQLLVLREALEAATRQQNDQRDARKEVELVTVVLERARQVATRLEDDEEDEELMAKQCWQEETTSVAQVFAICASAPTPLQAAAVLQIPSRGHALHAFRHGTVHPRPRLQALRPGAARACSRLRFQAKPCLI